MQAKNNLFRYTWLLSCFLYLSLAGGIAQKYSGLSAFASDGQAPAGIFDGNTTAGLWQDADNVDDAWLVVDLGSERAVGTVKIYWENANAKAYNLSFSNDDVSYWGALNYTDMAPGNRVDVLKDLDLTCRYIKMQGVTRQMDYGYALFEFEVFEPFLPALTTLAVSAAQDVVAVGNELSLTAQGLDQVGEPIDIEGEVMWTVDAQGATISPEGVFLAQQPGLYQVTALGGGAQGSVWIEALPANPNVALGKTYTSSSGSPVEAFDGNPNTRWESAFSDPQWIQVDLGQMHAVSDILISWEGANASAYVIEASVDGSTWNEVLTRADLAEGARVDRMYGLDFEARYVRLTGLNRNTVYGYSIWEMGVYGVQGGGVVDHEPPTTPGSFFGSPAVYAVFLTWNSSEDNVGVDHYKIFKDGVFNALMDANTTSMTISGLNPGTTYQFSIRAYDAAGNGSDEAAISVTTEERYVDDGEARYGIGNIALAMSTESSALAGDGGNVSSFAVDGNKGSRWESAAEDNAWMSVDLGLFYHIDRVILYWEVASGKHYLIQVSDDNVNWATVAEYFSEEELPHEVRTDELTFEPVTAKYIRIQGVERNTPWGYSLFEFEVYSPGSGPDDVPDPNPNPTPPPVPPGPSSFAVLAPAQQAMIIETRRPAFSWEPVDGATSYEVWVNITRDDYDWYAWGSLLDRFTKVAEVTSTSYVMEEDLTDRWTYKWYIVAQKPEGLAYSNLGVFSLYLPVITPINDGIAIVNGARDLNKNGVMDDYENWRLPVDQRVDDLMSKMTMEEKALQMFYNAQSFPRAGWAFGPGTVNDMFESQKLAAQTRLGIPFVSAGDNIHGYKTTYPVQSALAATRDMDLAYQCAVIHRKEQFAVGARGVLGPIAEVGTKVLYPRIQEGCGEDAELAAAMMRAMICGLQGGPEVNPSSVMVTTKHWPGQGAGGEAVVVYDAVTAKYHLKPWFAHMDAGGATVMPGYAGSTYLDPGGPGAGDSKKILDYLREVVGFEGPVCTDWLPYGAWVNAANAGSDIMGGADPGAAGFSLQNFIDNVPEERINEAVRRILTLKFKLGVFEDPYGDPVNGQNAWATEDSKEVAVDAARKAMTLLKNNGVLPLQMPYGSNLLVTGSRANDGDGYRIWTSYFNRELGAKTMYEAIAARGQEDGFNVTQDAESNPSAAVVVVGEPTYTHGTMWATEMPWVHDAHYQVGDYTEHDLTTLNEVAAMDIPMVVVVIMPRPYIIEELLEMADAVIIAYRPGDGGGEGLSQVLFGDYAPSGRLPWQLPRSMEQIGSDHVSNQAERWDLPFDLGATAAERQEIRSKIANNEPLYPVYGDPLFQYGFGIQGYESGEDDDIIVNVEDLSFPDKEPGIRLYPNPVQDWLNIDWPSDERLTSLQIYTLDGVKVKHLTSGLDDQALRVNLSELKTGMYLLKMDTQKSTVTQLIIKR